MEEVLTAADIEARFESEWMLIEEPETDEALTVRRGRVRWHSKDRLEGRESNLTRSAKVGGRELDRLVDNVDKFIAAVHRGVEVGMRWLEHERQSRGDARVRT